MKIIGMNSVLVCAAALAWLGCGSSSRGAEPPATPASEVPPEAPADVSAKSTAAAGGKTLEVALEPKSGSDLSGAATLSETQEGVKVILSVENVSPGEHGAHVHETGDCSAPDASSAGSHFSPESNPHALPAEQPRHLGDLGNLSVGSDGKGTLEIVVPEANLAEGDPRSFLGKAIIVHAQPDDGSQPSGNSGGRIGCGVIQ